MTAATPITAIIEPKILIRTSYRLVYQGVRIHPEANLAYFILEKNSLVENKSIRCRRLIFRNALNNIDSMGNFAALPLKILSAYLRLRYCLERMQPESVC
jgi:hypothetical protein